MEAHPGRWRRRTAEGAAIPAFVAVFLGAIPWVVHFASLAIFRVDPGATPETFAVVYRTLQDRYAVTGWRTYPGALPNGGFKTFRLPEAAGSIDGPKLQFSFEVLEDDGSRQVVEVRTRGLVRAVSRYAAYPDRVVPLSYRSLLWGYPHETVLPGAMIALAIAAMAAWGAFAAVKRLGRRP